MAPGASSMGRPAREGYKDPAPPATITTSARLLVEVDGFKSSASGADNDPFSESSPLSSFSSSEVSESATAKGAYSMVTMAPPPLA